MHSKKFTVLFALLLGLCYGNAPEENLRTIIVTGSSGEIGGAAARLLAQNYNLILTGRNLSELKRLQKELEETLPRHYEIQTLDYSQLSSVADFENYLRQSNVSLSGLVLIGPRPQFYAKDPLQEQEVWLDVFKNTFTGPLEVLKVTLPFLSKGGRVVVIAGTTSVQFQPEAGPSSVIRRMWTTQVKALSHTLGPRGIGINALSPGVLLTDFHKERIQKKARLNGIDYEAQMEEETAHIPLRRHGTPEEAAQAIEFLLSEKANFINGANIILDGGFTVSY